MIGGNVQGSVVRVAGAVDPITKKAEVRISVPASAPLVAGQSATLAIERAQRTTESGTISIPLSAVKITPDGTVVFSLGEGNALVARPVELGSLRGAFVEIVSGITLDDSIVTDARGLKEGQVVIVK
jgi:multidrug efflux pump subunit AcrA (membrane-fusion protein)